MLYFVLFINFLIFMLSIYTINKLRNVHLLIYQIKDQLHQENVNLFRQIEALSGLYLDLGINKSLPFTRGWAGSPDFLLTISKYVFLDKPEVIVECSSGVSTIVLAQSLKKNGQGHLFSLEHDSKFAEMTISELVRHGLSDWVTVVHSPLSEHLITDEPWIWYSLDHLPSDIVIDLLVIDGPPQATGNFARYPAGPLLFNRLAKNAKIILDDAARNDEMTIVARWANEYDGLQVCDVDCEKGCAVLLCDRT